MEEQADPPTCLQIPTANPEPHTDRSHVLARGLLGCLGSLTAGFCSTRMECRVPQQALRHDLSEPQLLHRNHGKTGTKHTVVEGGVRSLLSSCPDEQATGKSDGMGPCPTGGKHPETSPSGLLCFAKNSLGFHGSVAVLGPHQ